MSNLNQISDAYPSTNSDLRRPAASIDVIDESGAAQMLLPESRRRRTIGLKEIETTIATMARIPPKAVPKDDAEVLRHLEETLKRVVYGQDKAIEALAASIKLARAGLREPEKPIGCYLFSGPTGVGKTEVAKQLAATLGVELIRFDMSEYMERHTVSRLIGAPPPAGHCQQGPHAQDRRDRRRHTDHAGVARASASQSLLYRRSHFQRRSPQR